MALGALFFSSAAYGQGFGFNIGPFNMQFDMEGTYYANDHKDVLDSPLCYAIANQKYVDMIVEGQEKVNANELKIIKKRLVVAPYAFAVTQAGKPMLQGNIISEKLIKEVTVKYGEDKFGDKEWSDKKDEQGFFSGWFKSDKSQTIDIQKITNVFVVNDSHFDVPKNFKGYKGDNVKVICQLPIAND